MIANSVWLASCLPAYRRFLLALPDPETAQRRKLRSYLEENADTAFGRVHGLNSVRSYEEFTDRVPIRDYAALAPWIERIRSGEQNVLTRRPVRRLMPTSGTTSARKLIPMTADLQWEFTAAVAAWFADLCRAEPSLLGGRAYWSITPALGMWEEQGGEVPIGFDADTDYLSKRWALLIQAAMAVPPQVGLARNIDAFRYTTVLELLRCRDLRLISVWHPSFFSLLLETIEARWKELLGDVRRGTCVHAADFPPDAPRSAVACANRKRADELGNIAPSDVSSIWPSLRVVSCWGDGPSALAVEYLRSRVAGVRVQPKGLIATEAIVSIPFGGQYPLALDSHFLEFIGSNGQVRLANQLQAGEEYEVIVTTGGGLWRYTLGDRVKVTGFVGRTPSIQFLGRAGGVSDVCGEKLSEGFVAQTLAVAFRSHAPRFALLAPDENRGCAGYTLYVEGLFPWALTDIVDAELCANPHYAYCRKLGQLQPVRLFAIRSGGYQAFVKRRTNNGSRIGDVKPAALSQMTGWSEVFNGEYVTDASISPAERRDWHAG